MFEVENYLAKITFVVIFVLFILGVIEGNNALDMFIWGIALAIAVVVLGGMTTKLYSLVR